jgi:adenosylcobinamide kinase/adenosylcobinamide-phosphate guanylyltransferase
MAGLTLILGGAKSGKTGLALDLCRVYPAPRLYLATAQAGDPEMSLRIARHQAERGPEWRTKEEPLEAAAVIRGLRPGEVSVVLLDCLTLWLSNLLAGQGLSVDGTAARVEDLAGAVAAGPCPVVIVSNEVGLGIVPDNKLARDFRDAAGLAHQRLARGAEEVLLVTAGLVQKLK